MNHRKANHAGSWSVDYPPAARRAATTLGVIAPAQSRMVDQLYVVDNVPDDRSRLVVDEAAASLPIVYLPASRRTVGPWLVLCPR